MEGVEIQLHSFLSPELDGGNWSTPAPTALPPAKNYCRVQLKCDGTGDARGGGGREGGTDFSKI